MMRWIVGSSVKSRVGVIVAGVMVMAFGVWQLRGAKTDALPEFSPPTVVVHTEALGLSAEEVEQLITVPMEQDLLDGVAWLETIHSKSVPGLSSIEMIFEEGTDLYRARQVVQERISQAAGLPNVSKPPQMLQPSSSSSLTSMISLSSKSLTPIEVGVLARWTIRPHLLAVPGVSNVAIWGQRERQIQVQVDPQKLADKKVSLEQVISSTGNSLWVSPLTFLEASSPGAGGFVDTPNQRLGVQHNLPIIAPADLGSIAIEDADPLTLADVATVVEDHQPLIGDAIIDGGDGSGAAGYTVVVEKLPGANTAEVTAGVEQALDELRPALVGLDLDTTVFRPQTYLDTAVDNVTKSLLIGALLLLVILIALYFRWRPVVISFVSIVMSFVVAALVLRLFDQTFNLVVVAGLAVALGVVVDEGISGVGNRLRRRDGETDADTGAEQSRSAAHLAASAAMESGRVAVWAVVIFAVALLPVFLMDGLSGDRFFPPMAAASLVAVLASLTVAVTVTPALSVLLLRGGGATSASPVLRAVESAYGRLIGPALRTPLPVIAAGLVVLLVGALIVPGLDKSLLPKLKDTNLLVHWDAPVGTSLPEMDRITGRASAELRTVPGVRTVTAQVGQAILGDRPVGSDSADMWVVIDPSADYSDTAAAVRRVARSYPGVRSSVSTFSADKVASVLGRTDSEVTVRIFGGDLATLQQTAGEIKDMVSGIGGVRSAHVAAPASEPTLEVEVDLDKARVVGLKPGDVRRAAATLLSGLRVGSLFEKQKVFDVVVWSTPESRSSLSSVENLLIDTPAGDHIRIGDVATVRVRSTSPSIEHQDISRFVDVAADVTGDVDEVAKQVRQGLAKVSFPAEYHAEILDGYGHQQGSQRRLLGLIIAAAIGMYLLLQAAFASWRLATIAFATIPMALAGGVVAARIDGSTMTLATVGGLMGVVALTVRNALALIGRYRELRSDQAMPLGHDLVVEGARERLAPMLISLLAVTAVLLPTMITGSIPGQELLHQMAVVMVGGLLAALVVGLFVLPAMYLRFGPRQEPTGMSLADEFDAAEAALASGASAGD